MNKCSICGEEFDIEFEGYDIDDQYFCEHCQIDHIYTCPVCECGELEDRRGDIGSMLIVDSCGDDVGVPDGIYEIVKHPYYGGPIIGSLQIFPYAVRRMGDLLTGDKRIDTDGYPCGHVCRHCNAEVRRRAILFQKLSPNQRLKQTPNSGAAQA